MLIVINMSTLTSLSLSWGTLGVTVRKKIRAVLDPDQISVVLQYESAIRLLQLILSKRMRKSQQNMSFVACEKINRTTKNIGLMTCP